MAGLQDRGLKPADVTDLLITHAHHDHCINFPLLSRARIVIGAQEPRLGGKGAMGRDAGAELYVRELQPRRKCTSAADGEEVLPGIKAHVAPRPYARAVWMYVLAGQAHDVIFTGDAAKNRAEMICPGAPTRATTPAAEHPVDRGHLGALAQAAGHYPGARP